MFLFLKMLHLALLSHFSLSPGFWLSTSGRKFFLWMTVDNIYQVFSWKIFLTNHCIFHFLPSHLPSPPKPFPSVGWRRPISRWRSPALGTQVAPGPPPNAAAGADHPGESPRSAIFDQDPDTPKQTDPWGSARCKQPVICDLTWIFAFHPRTDFSFYWAFPPKNQSK